MRESFLDQIPDIDHDTIGMFYDREQNLFTDCDGFYIANPFALISPNDLYLFKLKKEYRLVRCRCMPDVMVEMFYPNEDEF